MRYQVIRSTRSRQAPLSKALYIIWTASSEFGTYRLCEQRRFRRACASAQSRQNLRCSLIQAVSQVEPSERKPDPWPLWMAGHGQLKFVMTECSKTQIRLTGLISHNFKEICLLYVCNVPVGHVTGKNLLHGSCIIVNRKCTFNFFCQNEHFIHETDVLSDN